MIIITITMIIKKRPIGYGDTAVLVEVGVAEIAVVFSE